MASPASLASRHNQRKRNDIMLLKMFSGASAWMSIDSVGSFLAWDALLRTETLQACKGRQEALPAGSSGGPLLVHEMART